MKKRDICLTFYLCKAKTIFGASVRQFEVHIICNNVHYPFRHVFGADCLSYYNLLSKSPSTLSAKAPSAAALNAPRGKFNAFLSPTVSTHLTRSRRRSSNSTSSIVEIPQQRRLTPARQDCSISVNKRPVIFRSLPVSSGLFATCPQRACATSFGHSSSSISSLFSIVFSMAARSRKRKSMFEMHPIRHAQETQ